MRVLWRVAPLLLALACGAPRYEGQGVVRGVYPDEGQVSIEHGDIPGLMSAMTMSFDVPDRALLERMRPGMLISFTLRRERHAFQVIDFELLEAGAAGSAAPAARLAGVRDPAPPFALTDQEGRPLDLADLRGSLVVLDFVFTQCTGPCPILTSAHVTWQRRLPAALRERTRFVSITLDPARDTPAALRAYAEARGADLSDWSFLTGPVAEVEAVVRAYGVGTLRDADGQIEHTLATFLIDAEGRIARRYLGLDHAPEQVIQDLQGLL